MACRTGSRGTAARRTVTGPPLHFLLFGCTIFAVVSHKSNYRSTLKADVDIYCLKGHTTFCSRTVWHEIRPNQDEDAMAFENLSSHNTQDNRRQNNWGAGGESQAHLSNTPLCGIIKNVLKKSGKIKIRETWHFHKLCSLHSIGTNRKQIQTNMKKNKKRWRPCQDEHRPWSGGSIMLGGYLAALLKICCITRR